MALLEHINIYWEFLGQCTQCGHCTDACASLTSSNMTLGKIAKTLITADRDSSSKEELAANLNNNTQLVQAVRGCFFCTSCKNTCFAHNDVSKLIYHARVDFQNLGLIPRDTWSSVQVDKEWDVFTTYRAVYGIDFTDLTRHIDCKEHTSATDCVLAFMPGCSLAAYAPELTREIFATLEELGGKTTLIDQCCGSPLKSVGFYGRAETLCNHIANELSNSGAQRLVCVCPGCVNEMRSVLMRHNIDIETVSLSTFLSEHGFTSSRKLTQTPLCFSKSCQDCDGLYLEQTIATLGVDPLSPVVFQGCCGSGGAVSAFDPLRRQQQADSKLSFVADGSTVVTMCPTCTYTYALHLINNPRSITNKHYTELLFNHQFDWEKVFTQLQDMWSGEYGTWVAQVLD